MRVQDLSILEFFLLLRVNRSRINGTIREILQNALLTLIPRITGIAFKENFLTFKGKVYIYKRF